MRVSVAAVAIACGLFEERVDAGYVSEIGAEDRLDAWRAIADEVVGRPTP
jgi:hypothetical protein